MRNIDKNENELIDIMEVVKITGLAKSTIYAEVYKKTIPYMKYGPRLLRFDRLAIQDWKRKRTVQV
jgi:excisionase family DNA binding protein